MRSDMDLKTQCYQSIREKILNCVYQPGSMIFENQLCTELQLSRTPIREALNRLEQEGWLQIVPKRGILVKGISVNDVLCIFQTRYYIEPIALSLAAPHLDHSKLQEFRDSFETVSSMPFSGSKGPTP